MCLSTTALYCCLDDFCKMYQEWERHHLIPKSGKRNRVGKLSLSEMMFIMLLFHTSGFKSFKLFYLYGVRQQYRHLFSDVPSYERFVALMPRLFMPLCMLLHHFKGEETGIYIADNTHLPACHNRRINRNKVFDGLAAREKSVLWSQVTLSYQS